MHFSVFSLGPISPTLSNLKIIENNEIKKEIVIDIDMHFKGHMEAELKLNLSYESLWIRNLPVRVNLKITEIFAKMRFKIAPRIKGVT